MAKLTEGAAQKAPAQPPPARPVAPPSPPSRTVTLRHLDVERHGNDDYTVTELTLEGPLTGPLRVVSTRRLGNEHLSANVARDWVRDWYREFAGTNLTGPYWR